MRHPDAVALEAPMFRMKPGSQRFSTWSRGKLGGLDVLVNNAGIAGPTGPVDSLPAGRDSAGRWTYST